MLFLTSLVIFWLGVFHCVHLDTTILQDEDVTKPVDTQQHYQKPKQQDSVTEHVLSSSHVIESINFLLDDEIKTRVQANLQTDVPEVESVSEFKISSALDRKQTAKDTANKADASNSVDFRTKHHDSLTENLVLNVDGNVEEDLINNIPAAKAFGQLVESTGGSSSPISDAEEVQQIMTEAKDLDEKQEIILLSQNNELESIGVDKMSFIRISDHEVLQQSSNNDEAFVSKLPLDLLSSSSSIVLESLVETNIPAEPSVPDVNSEPFSKVDKTPDVDIIPNVRSSENIVPVSMEIHVPEVSVKAQTNDTETVPSDKVQAQFMNKDELKVPTYQQPSSMQPPLNIGNKSVDNVPTTSNIPGDIRHDEDGGVLGSSEKEQLEVPNDMPSFDEWKQKEKEKNKQLEAEQTIQSTIPLAKVKGSKKRVNYASVTCGAKIIAANQEAQNPSFILIENKDQYMINPCKAKKVFTVELCEPVQVQVIDIGNLELFSSLPQSFDVHVSDRFPSKEWKSLGRFHARDERTIQIFQVDDSPIYAKYIKIEMLSHYGVEHYCPLSILRVFGTTLDDDDDSDDNENETPDVVDDETGVDAFAEDNPTNLFASATDTVLSLVKIVLNPTIDVTHSDDDDDAGLINDSTLTASDGNLSGFTTQTDQKLATLKPCVPDAIYDKKDDDDEKETKKEAVQMLPSVPQISSDSSGNNKRIIDDKSNAADVKTESDSIQEAFSVITLIEAAVTPLQEILDGCQFCDDAKNDHSLFDYSTVCGYYHTMMLSFVYPVSCLTAWRNLQKKTNPETVKESAVHRVENSVLKIEVAENENEKKDEDETISVTESDYNKISLESQEFRSSVESQIDKGENLRLTTSSEINHTSTTSDVNVIRDDLTVQNNLDQPIGSPNVYNTPVEMKQVQDHSEQLVNPRQETTTPEDANQAATNTSEMAGLVQSLTVQEGQGQTFQTQEHAAQGQGKIIQGQEQGQAQGYSSQNKVEPPKLADQMSNKPSLEKDEQGNRKEIYAELPSSKSETLKDYELDNIALDDITYQKLSSRAKESAFGKLKNRITVLELNLNLTNRYLEELSQRYKRQMEDMYSSLNKTITKLSNMAKTAEDRDIKQQDHISNLEVTVENLTTIVTSVHESIESMNRQMIERHLVLMLLELMVFIAILMFCVNRRHQTEHDRHATNIKTEFVQTSGVKGATDETKVNNGADDKRRKSADSQPFSDWTLFSSKNENASNNCVGQKNIHFLCNDNKSVTRTTTVPPFDFVKKRKKKKSNLLRSWSPSTKKLKDMDAAISSQPIHSPATGLIFGTCNNNVNGGESNNAMSKTKVISHVKRFSLDSSTYKPWRWNIFGLNNDQKAVVVSAQNESITSKPNRLCRSDVGGSIIANGHSTLGTKNGHTTLPTNGVIEDLGCNDNKHEHYLFVTRHR